MAENKKYVELLWHQKYDKLDLGEKIPIEKPNLPFQVVETVNKPRIKGGIAAPLFPEDEWPKDYPKDWKNLLIWGDNKLVMSSLLKQRSLWDREGKGINLIYIDPPFFTGADFTVRTKIVASSEERVASSAKRGEREEIQIEKEPSIIEERAYRDTWSGGIASYLKYMYERLVLMRELLAENGSIYVHLDQSIGHYVKVILDEIFGFENFLGEIIWYRYNKIPDKTKKLFFKMHDTILHYAKAKGTHVFNFVLSPTGKNIKRKKMKKINGKIATIEEYTTYEREMLLTRSVIDFIPDINIGNSHEKTGFDTQKSEELINLLISFCSNEGDIVADFFCGSGTTLAVAEKLGRRWIGSDLSKFAIQVTRKRLLDIHNSKDLLSENNKKYDKPARPFELWNIGNYETVYWQEREDEYLAFMLKLYQAQPLTGFRYLHGRKGERAVHIGPLNAHVTMEEVEKVVIECRANNFNKADVLGWEWNYEVNELAKALAKKNGVDLRLVQIPSVNEIKSSLVGFDLQLLKVPDQVVEKELAKHIKFPEVAYLEIDTKTKGKEVILKITDFQLSPTAELAEIAGKVKDSRELIDYKGDTFHNQWQSFRVKGNPKVDYEAKHEYLVASSEERGKCERLIMVKVVDVFGNDTNKIIKVKM